MGDPTSARRIETRFLVQNDEGVYGVTYRWNDAQTDARLVGDGGDSDVFEIRDGDTVREQVWRYPSRNDCLRCHTPEAGMVLGFHTAQLNRDFHYPRSDRVDNQIRALEQAGYFTAPTPGPNVLPALAAADDERHSLEYRVRSYLDVNCAQCHLPGGSGRGEFDARIETPTRLANLIRGEVLDRLGDEQNRLLVPGEPDHSVLLQRIMTLGSARMPPLASNRVDERAVALLPEWIQSDSGDGDFRTFAEWQGAFFEPDAAEADAGFDADGDRATNWFEFLTRTNPLDPDDVWSVRAEQDQARVVLEFRHLSNRAFEVQGTESLVAPDWRPLDLEANRRFFPAEGFLQRVFPPATGGVRYFRVGVIEP